MQESFDIGEVFVLVGLASNGDLPAVTVTEREELVRARLRANAHHGWILFRS